jgi:RNA polymerase sigma factor (sigma-70 family)
MRPTKQEDELTEAARRAAAGDRTAARQVVDAVADDVYELALRMLGHPADAEDAAQEILVIVLTHLGSFRGKSALSTWVWRIAANHLANVRRGRRETITFDVLEERLSTGLRDEPAQRPDPETSALGAELRLRCTEAMLLSLDRELRIAHLLGDIFGLPGEICAEILGIEPATFRKRLTRARARLYEFMGGWCGVFDEANPCRCARQVDAAEERGLISASDLYLSHQRRRPTTEHVQRASGEVRDLMQVAEVLRGDEAYAAPEAMVQQVRQLLESERLELLKN